MDWFRRNWPDLAIGVALVAVVALIVVTLLSGGSLASLVRRDTPPDLITDTTGSAQGGTGAAVTTPRTPDTSAQAAAPAGGEIDVFVPGVPSRAADPNAGQQAVEAGQRETATQTAAPNQPNTTTGPADALPRATQTGGFRVAAGAVDSRPAAVGLAETYREDGLPVTVEQQDDLYLLWVGPYPRRAEADRVAAQIIAGGGDALVYTYSGRDDAETAEAAAGSDVGSDANAATGAPESAPARANTLDAAPTTAATTPATTTPVTTTATTTAAAGDGATGAENVGQRYLQVGAFVSDESAAPLRAQLETLGLNVSRTEDESGLVRLFVGPFEDARLAQTQSRLSAEGIVGSFPVTR